MAEPLYFLCRLLPPRTNFMTTMSPEERSWRAQGLKEIIRSRDPGHWVDDQLADIDAKRAGRAATH